MRTSLFNEVTTTPPTTYPWIPGVAPNDPHCIPLLTAATLRYSGLYSDVDTQTLANSTLLHSASEGDRRNNSEIVQLLLENNVDPFAWESGCST